MKKIFISQSYSADPDGSYERAKGYAKQVAEQGHIPVSPVLMFHWVYRNGTDYETIIYACFNLIKMCDEVWIGDGRDASPGVMAELAYARGCGKPIKEGCE